MRGLASVCTALVSVSLAGAALADPAKPTPGGGYEGLPGGVENRPVSPGEGAPMPSQSAPAWLPSPSPGPVPDVSTKSYEPPPAPEKDPDQKTHPEKKSKKKNGTAPPQYYEHSEPPGSSGSSSDRSPSAPGGSDEGRPGGVERLPKLPENGQ